MIEHSLYHYKALVTDVYDGDTITVDLDLGLGIWLKGQKIRLYGINTPEVRGESRERGEAVRNWLAGRILGREIVLATHRDAKGKYGRWLGSVYLDGVNLNQQLLDEGMAEVPGYA